MVSLQLTAPGLRVLDASHAELQVLVDGVLDGTPELRELNISNNPLPALPARLASPGKCAEFVFRKRANVLGVRAQVIRG